MEVLARWPDGSLRQVEVTEWKESPFSDPWPDMHSQFSDYIVLERLGPDQDGCRYTLVERVE